MPRAMRRRKTSRRQIVSGSNQFEVEDLALTAVPGTTLAVPQPIAPPPLPQNQTGSEISTDDLTDISSIPSISQNSQTFTPSTHSSPSYLALKLAADLVPKFDGKSCSLTKFVRQCKLANSRIKPLDHENLLALIRNKIEGHAEKLIANRPEPEDLNALITELKVAFGRDFNVDRAHDDLKNVRQGDNEQAEFFGARVSEILHRGLEAAKERFNEQQVVGVRVLLNSAAVMGFTRGLRDRMFSTIITKEQPESLHTAIDIAARLEREIGERPLAPKPSFREVKAYPIQGYDTRSCYNCNQPGHLAAKCPEPSRLKCRWCGKYGHKESFCRSKLAGQPRFNPHYNPDSQMQRTVPLNSQGGLQKGTSQVEPLIAHANTTDSATNLN